MLSDVVGTSLNSIKLMLVSTLLMAAGAVAQEAEPIDGTEESQPYRRLHYIDVPVPIDHGIDPTMPAPPLPPDPELDPEFAERMSSIRQYQEAVLSIESTAGAWSSELIEELFSLGNLQQQQGDHLAAIATFDRAIHVNRINSGLHTLDQIATVERMIDSHIAIDNWEQADLYNNYLFYIQQKAYGTNDPRLIPVLNRLANWHIQAFNVGYGEPLGLRLSTAQILFHAAARMVNFHFGHDDERFVALLRNLASTAYLVTRYPEYLTELNRPEIRMSQDALRQRFSDSGSDTARGYSAGHQALAEIVEHYRVQPDKTIELAEAIAHLADWNLLFERRRSANALYAEAWQLLADLENGGELILRLFGQVVPIPAFMEQPTNLDPSSSESREGGALEYSYADLAFDVTAQGRVRNVRVLQEETPENETQLNRLRREIRTSYFRPVIVDGRPQRRDDNQFRYRYWY